MDPYDPDLYFSASASSFNRHGSRSLFSAAPAAVRTGASTSTTMMAGEKAEMIIYKLFKQMSWALFKYSLYALLMRVAISFLPWRRMFGTFREWVDVTAREIAPQIRAGLRGWFDLFVLLLIHIFRAATQNRWVVHARRAVGDWFVRIWRAILNVIYYVRHYWLWDLIYLHSQLIFNWFGRRKMHLVVFIVGIHLLSTLIQSENNKTTEVFINWSTLQQYIDTPIPEYMFWRRLEDGSNSHYHREASWWPDNADKNHCAQLWLGRSISAAPIATMQLEEAIASSARDVRTENDQQETVLVEDISTTPTTTKPLEQATASLDHIRELKNEQIWPGMAEDISPNLTPTMLLEEDALPSTEVHETEKRQKLLDEKVAFCQHCRQEHCCEVYI